ncbi:MAG: hypothetical protein R6U66_08365 [Bacteroidales bacterium]
MKKLLFLIAALLLSTSLFAIKVTIYGSGGATYKDGEVTVCPKSAEAACATLDLKTGELIELKKADVSESTSLYRIVRADFFVLDNGEIGVRNVVLQEYKKRRP